MEFAFSEEQQELAATVRSLLTKRADSRAVRAAVESDAGYDESLWQTLCEQIGAAALGIPEEYDGAGFSLFESLIVLEEVGRSLAPSPLLASLVAAETLLATDDEDAKQRLLARIATGEVATVAPISSVALDGDALTGTAHRVLDGDRATVLLVAATSADGVALFEVDPASVQRAWTPSMDQSVRLATLTFDGTPATRITGDAAAALERAERVGAVGVAAMQAGCAARALEMTVAYTKERVQFGRPIGSFQALKHRMADMLVLVEMSRSASWAASYAVSTRADNADQLAHVAKSYCSDALSHIAGETVQLHGGIAITWEHDAQLVFKRAHALGQLFGQPHEHRALIEL
ncbi:acyl-CoA dehydrogenase family protein [Nocardioides sp.]|uniref:acyl-CoA dehydrogenase family protein n=1 Tax=Nocardioides sp. TaxID=35761 RepID=UPI0031FEFCE4|nr:mmgC 7 [Nocardioides sp.]